VLIEESVGDGLGIIWGPMRGFAQIHDLSTFADPGCKPYPKGSAGLKCLIA
jgi:hypothetical protein